MQEKQFYYVDCFYLGIVRVFHRINPVFKDLLIVPNYYQKEEKNYEFT
jgi:hypothetical protein